MPQSTGNSVSTSQGGLVPINFGNTKPSPAVKGFVVPNTKAGGTNPIPSITSGISNFLGPMGNQSTAPFAAGGSTQPTQVGSFAQSNGQNNNLAVGPGTSYAFNGVNYDAAGGPVNKVASYQTQTQPVPQYGASNTGGTLPSDLNTINASNMNSNGTFINDSGSGTGAQNTQQNTQPNIPQTQGPTLGGAATGLLGLAGTQSDAYKAAQEQYNNANEQLKALKLAAANNQLIGAGTNMAEYAGTQGLLANRLANQENALTGEMNAAQSAAQTATGQQSVQQSGFNQAGGLVSPQQVPYSNQYLNPTNGSPVGGGGGSFSLNSAAKSYAQKVQSGNMSYNDAVNAMGGYGVAGQQALNAALPTGFNVNKSNATAQSQSSQTAQQQQYQSAAQQANNLGQQLNQVITQAGINPSDINKVNSFIQGVANNTSNPNYQTFQNLINDMANTYAQVLTPAGGSTTDMVRQISGSLLNSTQSGQSILQVMQNLDNQVQAKITGVTTAYGNTNTTSGSTPSGWF